MKEDKLFINIIKKFLYGHYKEMQILVLCEMLLAAIAYAVANGY